MPEYIRRIVLTSGSWVPLEDAYKPGYLSELPRKGLFPSHVVDVDLDAGMPCPECGGYTTERIMRDYEPADPADESVCPRCPRTDRWHFQTGSGCRPVCVSCGPSNRRPCRPAPDVNAMHGAASTAGRTCGAITAV